MNWKENFPIASQWKCRDGSRAVVVDQGETEFIAWNNGGRSWYYTEQGKFRDTVEAHNELDLIEPWEEPRVFEDEIIIVDGGYGNITRWLGSDWGAIKDLGTVIARKKITITEGEGMSDG